MLKWWRGIRTQSNRTISFTDASSFSAARLEKKLILIESFRINEICFRCNFLSQISLKSNLTFSSPCDRPRLCQLPTANSQQPAANCQQPTASCQLPAANCQLPTANSQLPTANSQQPTANSQQPAASCQLPAASCQLPAAYSQQPTANGQVRKSTLQARIFR